MGFTCIIIAVAPPTHTLSSSSTRSLPNPAGGAPLVPMKLKMGPALEQQQHWPRKEDRVGSNPATAGQGGPCRDIMDDLVDRLAALESVADFC